MSPVSTAIFNPQTSVQWRLKQGLDLSIKTWIAIILAGQWIFALYIFMQFTLPLLSGQLNEARYAYMITGYVNGNTVNNTILFMHVLPVMVISLSGTLQLFPSIRAHFPRFHRLNGRVYLAVGLLGAIGGLYMTWVSGSRLSNLGALGVTLNGLLIPVMVYFTWKFAVQRNYSVHRRCAVHAFILINGVWTFRLYLMGWFMINQGALGNSANIDGPADIILSFASYLLPMLVAELVFKAQKHYKPSVLLIAVIAVVGSIAITVTGIIAATMLMWGPTIIGN